MVTTGYSRFGTRVIQMEPDEYAAWLDRRCERELEISAQLFRDLYGADLLVESDHVVDTLAPIVLRS